MSNFGKEENFKFVKSKKSKYKNINRTSNHKISENLIEDDVNITEVLRKIKDTKVDLNTTEYFTNSIERLDKAVNLLDDDNFNSIICFGLGQFSSCITARYQLAYILAIREHYNIKDIQFHDPIFSKGEIDILHQLNCKIIKENREGKEKIIKEEFTLLYLPHCPKQLTNNFLWCNWSLDLCKIVIIGNSFTNIITSTIERDLKQNAAYILKIHNYTNELELENKFKYTDIFNDTSIHIFPKTKLNLLPIEFWEDCKEPEYQIEDTELIKSNQIIEEEVLR